MAINDANLKASWSFNNTWLDDTANGNDINNTGATFGTGKILQGGVYDGSNDGGLVTHNASVSFNNDFTIMIWVNTVVKDIERHAISKRQSGTAHNYQIRLLGTSGFSDFVIFDGTTVARATGTTDLCDGAWHQIVTMRDMVNDELVLIVDNIVEDKVADNTTGSITNTNDVGVGRRNDSAANRWKGGLDISLLSSRKLTYGDVAVGQQCTGEVATLWNGGAGLEYPFIIPTGTRRTKVTRLLNAH